MWQLKNKKVLVVGLGLQGGGVGLIKFLHKHQAKITVTDKKTPDQLKSSLNRLKNLPLIYRLGSHNINDFLSADLIFKGPSVPWTLPEILAAEQKKIPVMMETAFFVKNCPAKIIGITGTRGKTTTTLMTEVLFRKFNQKYFLAGNLPQKSTISLLDKVTKDDWVILELSSWQLSGFHRLKISPPLAIFTNLYPDHLNYYSSVEEYYHDKKAIFAYQKSADRLIANLTLKPILQREKILSRITYFSAADFPDKFNYLKGEHNRENAAAVYQLAKLLKFNLNKTQQIISNFPGVSYRQQIIAKKDGIIFINDTTATTPTATIQALKTFADKPIVLLLGNSAKNLPTKELIDQLKTVEKIVWLKGDFTDQILPQIKKLYPEKSNWVIHPCLQEAVKQAYNLAKEIVQKKKDEVYLLFSPAAASFSMFNNEFERGNQFNYLVKKLLIHYD